MPRWTEEQLRNAGVSVSDDNTARRTAPDNWTQGALPGIEKPNRVEDDEQKEVVAWCRTRKLICVASLNGAHLQGDATQRAIQWERLKALGAYPGWFDLVVISPDARHLYIEMKRIKGGSVSENQAEVKRLLDDMGIPNAICRGADEAIEVIKDFLSGGNP